MDALSSQATVAGYKAVLIAADAAAAVLPDADDRRGHGRAGEGARARRRRRRPAGDRDGAAARRSRVGFDVRPVVREQVESLGATFLDLGVVGEETEGGYARELSPRSSSAQQQEALERAAARVRRRDHDGRDPGRPRAAADPRLGGRGDDAGSVIVDLAAETGGNCELTEPGDEVVRARRDDRRGDRICRRRCRSTRASSTRATSSRCSQHLAPEGELELDFDDEITAARLRHARSEVRA